MKFFNEQEGANNGSPFVELVVYGFIIFVIASLSGVIWWHRQEIQNF